MSANILDYKKASQLSAKDSTEIAAAERLVSTFAIVFSLPLPLPLMLLLLLLLQLLLQLL